MTDNITSRKLYLDNMRAFTVLLLFPYHTFMVYNTFGESWYIHGADIPATTLFLEICWGWMMPLLFAIAGISAANVLEHRSIREYASERVKKLLIPLLFGVILLVPIQAYIAGIYFRGNANYLNFFTKITDLTGYDGAFSPGQLWFIFYLFVMSIVCMPFMAFCQPRVRRMRPGKISLIVLILIGIIPLATHPILNIAGKSFGEFIVYFGFGYSILSHDDVIETLERHRFLLFFMMVCGMIETVMTNHMFQEFFSWIHVLALLGLAKHYLNFGNPLTSYLSKSSFGVYLFHQSWIVIVACLALKITAISTLQILIIMPLSMVLTFLTYEGCKRVYVLRWMFGLKK